jgi:TolB-like protein
MATLAVAAFCLFAATIVAVNRRSLSPWEVRSAPRLSIVVLPFANVSNDPDQQYFADGITEDLTTDLSRISDMVVISRDTAFTYRNKPVNAEQIGRELSVRYVLEGSIRRSGERVRVNTQLVDAATDTHLWAERFDSDIADLFTLQNEITGRLANTLGIEMTAAEAARPTEEPDALDYILRGRAATLKPNSPESWAEAISMFERALALDPQSVEAQSRLANALVARTRRRPTSRAQKSWSAGPWPQTPALRMHIKSKAACCKHMTGMTKPLRNSRRHLH